MVLEYAEMTKWEDVDGNSFRIQANIDFSPTKQIGNAPKN